MLGGVPFITDIDDVCVLSRSELIVLQFSYPYTLPSTERILDHLHCLDSQLANSGSSGVGQKGSCTRLIE
jgi:hypothetical protein